MDLCADDAIKKYGIPLETTPMDPEALKKCSYVLIRHGLSEFNYKDMVAREEFGEESEERKKV